jgi:hypothetical protein
MIAFAHWAVLPVVLPMLAGALALLLGPRQRAAQAVVSIATVAALAAIAMRLLADAIAGGPQAYLTANWRAPFGIVLVADRLSATLLLLTAALATGALAYALVERSDFDRRAVPGVAPSAGPGAGGPGAGGPAQAARAQAARGRSRTRTSIRSSCSS